MEDGFQEFDDFEDDGYITYVDSELEEEMGRHQDANDFDISDDEFEKNTD